MKNKLKNIFCLEFFVILVYMVVTFITLLLHEPWFDEAQSWMIAKDLNVFEIINQMKFEGHSALWLLFLHGFVKLGFNYNIQNIFSWFLSILGVTFLMYIVNISKLIKVPLIFTIGPLYYCSVFARPYILIFLVFILLLHYYDKRYEHPYIVSILLLILSNTHLMVMGFMGALFLVELYGYFKYKNYKKERIILMSFMVLGVLLFFFQIIGSIFYRKDIVKTSSIFDYVYTFISTIKEFLYSHGYFTLFMFGSFILFVILIIILKRKNIESFLIFIFSLLFFLLLSTFIYYLNEFKYFYIIVVLLFCFRNLFDDKIVIFIFCIFLMVGITSSIREIVLDWNKIYSIELNIYKDLEDIDNDEYRIISLGEASVLAMYCDKCKIYNLNVNKFVSYNPYVNDLTDKGITYDNIVNVIEEENMDYILMKRTYYNNSFLKKTFNRLENEGIMKLYKKYDNGIISDDYYLFYVDKK